jgi:hypothetical protein
MSTIFLCTLDERLSQGGINTQGNHVNVEEIKIDLQKHDYSSPLGDLHHRGRPLGTKELLNSQD